MRSLGLIISSIFSFVFLLITKTEAQMQAPWMRLDHFQEGIYKLDYLLAKQIGIPVDEIDPRTIKIYTHGYQGALPQILELQTIDSLTQSPLWQSGFEDGIFHNSDFILYYHPGPSRIQFSNQTYTVERSPYSLSSGAVVTYGEGFAKEIKNAFQSPESEMLTYYHAFVHAEEDEVNLTDSGRKWYGSFISRSQGLQQTINFSTEGALDSAWIRAEMIGFSDINGSFTFSVNGKNIGEINFPRLSTRSPYIPKGRELFFQSSFAYSDEKALLQIKLNENNALDLLGNLDKVTLTYRKPLVWTGQPFVFSKENKKQNLKVENANDQVMVWDVGVPKDVLLLNKNGEVYSGARADNTRLAVFSLQNVSIPQFVFSKTVTDWRAFSPRDGMIVSHSDFLTEAERLAEFHRSNSGLDIVVLELEDLFLTFSAGTSDVTAIRNAAAFFKKKNPTFRYLLLFGDCSFDYLGITTSERNRNKVPIYESYNSLDPVNSYSSDDYFGFLEDGEGEWLETSLGDNSLELGIGRLPVKSLEEAKNMVDKIIRYATSNQQLGFWKNQISYVADDGDNARHMLDAEDLALYLDQTYPALTTHKFFLDSYPQEIGKDGKQKAPQLEKELKNQLEEGTFVVVYMGHGSETQWTQEAVLTKTEISNLKNRSTLPLFITATCEFGRYDDSNNIYLEETSGAEDLLLNPNGGAIALIATSRPVYAFSNFLVNAAFHITVFDRQSGAYPRLGDIIRLTKNQSLAGPINRNFALLGDPFLTLDYPDQEIVLTHINGKQIDPINADTLSALEEVTFQGEIRNEGMLDTTFSGELQMTLFDRATTTTTLGQENSPINYQLRENRIFNGRATVSEGVFSITTRIPKNISYRFDQGRIVFYAKNEKNNIDATGAYTSIRLGGNSDLVDDIESPKISMYIDDPSFSPGDLVVGSFFIMVDVQDDSGFNITGLGVGQQNTLTISSFQSQIINNYFIAEKDDYKKGKFIVPISDLPNGEYSAHVIIWDANNNPATATVSFIVDQTNRIKVFEKNIFPNPATEFTQIYVRHDRKGEPLELYGQLLNASGQLIKEETYFWDEGPESISDIKMFLPYDPGVYFLKIKMKSMLDGAESIFTNRILLIEK